MMNLSRHLEHSVGINQPYLFPYIGYFQLINAVNQFVVYDDVNFIKSGWINRNLILQGNKAVRFTLPLENASSNQAIKNTKLHSKLYPIWREKFKKTLKQSYSKAPYFKDVYPLVENVFSRPTDSIGELATFSLITICKYLDIKSKILVSSAEFAGSRGLERADRIIQITKELRGRTYINPMNGTSLYEKDYFLKNGVELYFINPIIKQYEQRVSEFVPSLSIIDVIMFNSKEHIQEHLLDYKLI